MTLKEELEQAVEEAIMAGAKRSDVDRWESAMTRILIPLGFGSRDHVRRVAKIFGHFIEGK